MAEKPYPKIQYVAHTESAVLQCNRVSDKTVKVPRDLPGNIILVHGVNDVGMDYSVVEEGLCAGLGERLFRHFTPAGYTLPGNTDKERDKVADDPDAVFFKRKVTADTDSPVIPFYWGYRELQGKTLPPVYGQQIDRNGNRLDKDLSKGGGPFANATSSLPDMWNRGVYAPTDPIDDPLRPLKTGPGRMYMVLAARRLAALIGMIRKFEPKDTVSIVAHSQGCLLSLLAQAFLMERGERTADTLILTHPPYALDEEMGKFMKTVTYFQGDKDASMESHYGLIDGRQSLHARLQTLVNIVSGVVKSRAAAPAFAKMNGCDNGGMVGSRWEPGTDRDNRGKVYLYFCPEDMTVALDNVRGIGWQGVPDYIQGTQYKYKVERQTGDGGYGTYARPQVWSPSAITRQPMAELGIGFFQRVFTAKRRLDPRTKKTVPVLVGQLPHDFPLRIKGEDDHAHVAASVRGHRESLPVAKWPISPDDKPEAQRHGIRAINGDALHPPCEADLRGTQIDAEDIPVHSRLARVPPNERGPSEAVDPVTAEIALTGPGGVNVVREELSRSVVDSWPGVMSGQLSALACQQMQQTYNAEKLAESKKKNPNENGGADANYAIITAWRGADGRVVADVMESPNAARRRWQHELAEKSFHSAIFGSRENHRRVTAYDVAIGSGKASTHPKFYAYLCAVADWRLKDVPKNDIPRKGILTWQDFLGLYGAYYECELESCKQLIRDNVDYYTKGELPSSLPVLSGRLWDIVISELTTGKRVNQPAPPKR
jgi:hypothetical protein